MDGDDENNRENASLGGVVGIDFCSQMGRCKMN